MESPKNLYAYSRYTLNLGRKRAQFVIPKLSPLTAPQFRGISYPRKCRPVDLFRSVVPHRFPPAAPTV